MSKIKEPINSKIVKNVQPDKGKNTKTKTKPKPKPRKRPGPRGKYHQWIERDGLIKLEAWARDGLTDEQIAHNAGIAYSTLKEWKNRFPAIMAALKRGKEVVDFEVENALLKRALGYSVEEEVTTVKEVNGIVENKTEVRLRHIPGDTTAQIFWLKNRKREAWRDRQELQLRADEAVSVIVDYGDNDDETE